MSVSGGYQASKMGLRLWLDPLTNVHYAYLKLVMKYYIQEVVQIKWDMSVHGRDVYLLKPTLGLHRKSQYLTRTKEVVIT